MSMTDDEAMNQLHALMTQAIATRDGKERLTKSTAVAPMVLTITSGAEADAMVLKLNPHPNGMLNGEIVGAD